MNTSELKGKYLLGRCSNGFERDKGTLVHLVRGDAWQALCGKRPGRTSAGWGDYNPQYEKGVCEKCMRKAGG